MSSQWIALELQEGGSQRQRRTFQSFAWKEDMDVSFHTGWCDVAFVFALCAMLFFLTFSSSLCDGLQAEGASVMLLLCLDLSCVELQIS